MENKLWRNIIGLRMERQFLRRKASEEEYESSKVLRFMGKELT